MKRINKLGFMAVVGQFVFASLLWSQENCPRFRGVDGTGVAANDARLPDQWDQEQNVAWKVDVPGSGCSSPIVWGDRVFVTSVVGDEKNIEPKTGLYLGQGVLATFCPDQMVCGVLAERCFQKLSFNRRIIHDEKPKTRIRIVHATHEHPLC